MSPALVIWVDNIRAAELHAVSSGMQMCYTQAWLDYPYAYPFSPHLPLQQVSGGIEVKYFFENLLPEGTALDVAASTHKLSKHDAFGLLAKIGREAAGALCLLPPDEQYDPTPELRPVPHDELAQRIGQRPQVPFTAWDKKFRLSIAGYQDKLAIYLDQQQHMYLPERGASSTHIIKPENANKEFAYMPANEYFCMRLAKALKIQVPEVGLLRIPNALFQVARYDRRRQEDGSVQRLHQIDLCQVLNLPVEMKYQHAYAFSPQGATYADLFKATALAAQPAKARLQVLDWIVFNYLIGNTDAHAKNVSFFLDHAGLRVAPFYDLVCGTIYGLKDLALFIGMEEEIHLIGTNDWAAFCEQCVINRVLLAKQLHAQASAWKKTHLSILQEPVFVPEEMYFLTRLAADIDSRAQLMIEQAAQLRKLGNLA